ncbi:MAG: hypothetical protein IJU21_01075 [Bacteroidales bacterium]|nr:hypothetical protein [Bacteroidales bacterium]
MAFQRIVFRTLPDGKERKVYPFHISMEGMESVLLCRDDDDYDHLEKSFYVSAWKTNCIVIMEIAMSNHGHCSILAENLESAFRMANVVKKRHSQYLSWKYNDKSTLARSDISVKYLDSDWYVRNALAYIPRNAIDAGSRVEDYRWSAYRGMFSGGRCPNAFRSVSSMGRRERERVFRTHEDLSAVPWLVNYEGGIEPASACDYAYLESAFSGDQAFFLRKIGEVNVSEMQQLLVSSARNRQTDAEMFAVIRNLADKWYHVSLPELTPEHKARLLPYLYRSYNTSVPQLARCLSMPRDVVSGLLASSGAKTPQGKSFLSV